MTKVRWFSALEFTGPTAQNAKALSFNSQNFVWPGDVLSTSVKAIRADLGGFARIAYARIVAVWTCQQGAVLRVVKADSGPTNIENVGAWVYPSVIGTPSVSGVDITAGLQEVIDCGIWKQIGIQLSGAGTLNRATIEITWEIDLTPPDLTSLIDRVEALENGEPQSSQEPPTTIEVPATGALVKFVQAPE